MINRIIFPFLCILAYVTPVQAQHESIGTIEAKLDGMPKTIHVLSVEGVEAASGAAAIKMPVVQSPPAHKPTAARDD